MREIIGPVSKTNMIIKKPVKEIFECFVEPEKLTKFWLSKASAKLELGKTVTWDFMVQGAASKIEVKKFEDNKVIDLRWENGTTTELRFEMIDDNKSIIDIRSYGFEGTDDEKLKAAIDNTAGFTFVVCDLKTFLEEGKSMNICRDKAELIMKK